MNQYIFYDFVFDSEEIDNLLQQCYQVEWKLVSNRYYHDLTIYPDPAKIVKTYLDYLPEYEKISAYESISKQMTYFNDVKISKYEKDNDFNWHSDYSSSSPPFPNGKRLFTSITYLNDDYEGGETEFSCGVCIKPEAGKTLIFPSTWLFPHRGKAVIEGTKYIYVNHIWA
jgi:hypothetical protein